MRRPTCRLAHLVLVLVFLAAVIPAHAADPVVHAILFYSPTCPHCHQVIDNDLPPLMEQYGDQLEIMGINTAHPDGQALYQAAITYFEIPSGRRGVPTLIVGDHVLVGSSEIPAQFPGLIEEYLAAGGVDWPAIPGLAEIVAVEPEEAEPVAEATTPPAIAPGEVAQPAGPAATADTATPVAARAGAGEASPPAVSENLGGIEAGLETESITDRFRRDVRGNALSVVVLVGMVVAVIASFRRPRARETAATPGWPRRAIPALVVAGLVVASYLTFVETTGTEAVCGPVGDCNTVQQSPYATLFGFLPVGVLGLIGYVALGLAWLAAERGVLSYTPLVFMAFGGTLFSIYLTFLEPFVIGATCLWCLSSAVIVTLILLLAMGQAPLSSAGSNGRGPQPL